MKNKDIDKLRNEYISNKCLIEEINGIDLEYLQKEIKLWDYFNNDDEKIANNTKYETELKQEINDISKAITQLNDEINELYIVNEENAQVLYYEHYKLMNNQSKWLNGPNTNEIDNMIKLHNDKNILHDQLKYWISVKEQKPNRDLYNTLISDIHTYDIKLQQFTDLLKSMEVLKTQQEKSNNIFEYLNDLNNRIDTLQYMSIAFKEYRQYLFNNHILPYVLKRINYIVSRVSENSSLKLMCSLNTVNAKTNSKTKLKDVLNWSFNYDNSILPIERTSGFQRFMFALAKRVSLTKINAKIRNRQLFIDEGFTTFDEVHLAKVHDIFESLKSDYDNIIIVSHLNEIKENIPNKIHINRCNGFSDIQFGNRISVKELELKKCGRKKKDLFEEC